jgi:hypothetical protein
LACFRATADAGCEQVPEITGARIMHLTNSTLTFGNKKYGDRHLAEITYHFDRRFNVKGLLRCLLIACIDCRPQL